MIHEKRQGKDIFFKEEQLIRNKRPVLRVGAFEAAWY